MKTLELNQMENVEGGNTVDAICVGIGAGDVVYSLGVELEFWNPIGWLSAAMLVASAACTGYAASQL